MRNWRVLALVGLLAPLAAQDPAASDDRPGGDRFVDMSALPGGQIEAAVREWLADAQIMLGVQSDGAYIDYAVKPVAADTASNDWGFARIAAFRTAELEVRAKLLRFLRTEAEVDMVASMLDDSRIRDRLGRSTPADLEQEIEAKTRALETAELDARLRELGVSADRIAELSAAQKHVEFRSALQRTAKTCAIGRIAGMRPLQTFEGEDRDGNYAVAVVAVWSPRQQALAARILRGDTGSSGDGETVGVRIDEVFEGGDASELFVDQYGVRLVTDADGRQAILAFAQSAPRILRTDSPLLQQKRVDAARKAAQVEARAMIQEFLGSTIDTSEERRTEEVYEKFLSERGDGRVDDVADDVQFIDWFSESTRASARGIQVGVQMLSPWQSNHPLYGHPLVGVVAMWSPNSAEMAAIMAAGGTATQRGEEAGGRHPGVRSPRSLEGKQKKPKW